MFTYARYINPSNLVNASAASRSTLGFNTTGFYGVTTSQVPNVEGPWGGAVPNIDEFSFDGAFNGGNGFGAIKKDPSLYDNFTKVIGLHTLKAGFYWDTSGNVQSTAGLQLETRATTISAGGRTAPATWWLTSAWGIQATTSSRTLSRPST